MKPMPQPARLALKACLALACLASVVICSRSALKDTGEFQYNSAVQGSMNFYENFQNAFYLRQGIDIYDPAVIQKYALQPNYLPNSFLMIMPFTYLPWPLARGLWLALNLLFTVLLARQISDLFLGGRQFPLLFALVACSASWATLIHAGQFTLWSFCFFLLAVKWEKEGCPVLSGLAIALCLLKYVLTTPLMLYFLIYRRSWKNLAVAGLLHGAVFSLFCLWLKLSPVELFMGPVRSAKAMGVQRRGYLDLLAFWDHLTGKATGIPYYLSVLLVLGVLAWTLLRLKGKDDLGALSLTVMAALTVMFHNNYDYVGAVFPLAWCLQKPLLKDRAALAVLTVAVLVLYVTSHYLEFFRGMDAVMDFMKSGAYLGGLALLWYAAFGLLAWRLVHPPAAGGN